ncbi:MAG: DNA polymerase III subunit delta, partial [Parvibaculaceae bacterium]|nr:DNA polymerase III subunit delta [Parvibaculaceae bacterium]
MKLKPREIDAFVRKPDPSVQAILVFGPDQGLAHDRLNKIAKTVVDDLSDPFRVVDMNDTDLKSDPARLPDEAAAISMMGGRRIVRIRNASDGLTKIVKPFLENPTGDALILFQAGDLTPRSSLRKLFEGSKKGAIALPCYADDARSLEGIIRETLNNAKLSIEPEAL